MFEVIELIQRADEATVDWPNVLGRYRDEIDNGESRERTYRRNIRLAQETKEAADELVIAQQQKFLELFCGGIATDMALKDGQCLSQRLGLQGAILHAKEIGEIERHPEAQGLMLEPGFAFRQLRVFAASDLNDQVQMVSGLRPTGLALTRRRQLRKEQSLGQMSPQDIDAETEDYLTEQTLAGIEYQVANRIKTLCRAEVLFNSLV